MISIGRFLILVGVLLVVLGVILAHPGLFPFLKLGRLPGDIRVKREHFQFYFPLTTCILVSLLLTLLFYIIRK